VPHKDPEVRRAYVREYHAKWYAKNGDKRRAQIRQYKRANPTKVANGDAAYRSRPEVRAAATQRKQEWRAANVERDRASKRSWAKSHREQLRAYDRRYRGDRSEYNARWYEANREYCRVRDSLRYIARRDGVSSDQFDLMAAFAGIK
jgi:hypothetical protein